jgi:hypothetical protein
MCSQLCLEDETGCVCGVSCLEDETGRIYVDLVMSGG